MSQLNVVDLGKFKEKREAKRSMESYTRYLKTLGNSQLEIEVNSLLEEFSHDSHGPSYFSKSQLILKEISSRADQPVKKKIELMNQETLRLL